VTEAVKLLLDLPVGLTPSSRDNLSDILGNFAPPQSWGFVMLNPEQQRLVVKAINESEKPLLTRISHKSQVHQGSE